MEKYRDELKEIAALKGTKPWSTAYLHFREASAVLRIADELGYNINHTRHTVEAGPNTTVPFLIVLESFRHVLNQSPSTIKNKFALVWKAREFLAECYSFENGDDAQLTLTGSMEGWKKIIEQWLTNPYPKIHHDHWWYGGKRTGPGTQKKLQEMIVSLFLHYFKPGPDVGT